MKKKILVTDDDAGNRKLVIEYMRVDHPDCEMLIAPHGRIACDIAREEQPDLIIMDWEMPVMNGLEALQTLKKNPATTWIPVVMYTGVMTGADHLRRALDAGAHDFLRKPVDRVELQARIQSIFRFQEAVEARLAAEKNATQLRLQATERELQLKSQELAAMTQLIENKNTFLESMRTDLQQMLDQVQGESLRTGLSHSMAQIELDVGSDSQWEMLRSRMDDLHSGMIARLTELFPDLTRGELRFCSLLRLNLTNKELAEMLNVTGAAIEKRRNRLRKKLNLVRGASIENFLNRL